MKVAIALIALSICLVSQAQVKIEKEAGGYRLSVDGKPFELKGVTFGMPIKEDSIDASFKELKNMGVNAIRNWGCGNDTQLLLDTAAKYDVKVLLGIWMRHGRSGAEGDDNFNYVNDDKGKENQFNDAIKWVNKFKDHKALLGWGIGNEVILNIGSEEEKVAYAKFLEKVCSEVKKIDPNHPIFSAGAWTIEWKYWKQYTPSLDVYGVNTYGWGATALPDELKKNGIDKPYVLTEFGPRGEWDAPKDSNGLKIEPSEKEKVDTIIQGVPKMVKANKECLGAFIFNFGKGTDHGGVWLNFKIGDAYRPYYWAIREVYTGQKAPNACPEIAEFSIPNSVVKPEDWVPVVLKVSDKEDKAGDLKISFNYNHRENGSRNERDAIKPLNSRKNDDGSYSIQAPKNDGLYKIYAYCQDSYPNLSIAYTSLFVTKQGSNAGEPGQKAQLPLFVFDNTTPQTKLPYVPSGLMGNFKALKHNMECTENPHSAPNCIEVAYSANGEWIGLAWQSPANDWGGEKPGGYDLTGAKSFKFWARGKEGGEKVKFGFGMIGREKKYFDTAKKETGDLVLEKEWKEYSIPIDGCDLRRIKTGFTMFFGGQGKPITFYLDDIRYE